MTLTIKALLWVAASFLLMALALFLSAGTIAWLAGWIFLILLHGWLLVGIWLLLKYNPGLLQERVSLSQTNQKAWDKAFLLLYNLFLFAWLVLMPLDSVRFRWSQMPLLLQVAGAVALVGSFFLVSLTFRGNSFLSPTVRIQEERRQTAISTGPYQYVRHPMYAGGLLLFLGTSLLLGSWYGLGLFLLFIPGIEVRAVLEERVLHKELPGYDAYMARVKYRLIPSRMSGNEALSEGMRRHVTLMNYSTRPVKEGTGSWLLLAPGVLFLVRFALAIIISHRKVLSCYEKRLLLQY